jgi:hypothetical protein
METATDANQNGKRVCLDSTKQLHPLTGNPSPTERARRTSASAIVSLHPVLFSLANESFSRFFELKTTHERHLETAKRLSKDEFFFTLHSVRPYIRVIRYGQRTFGASQQHPID